MMRKDSLRETDTPRMTPGIRSKETTVMMRKMRMTIEQLALALCQALCHTMNVDSFI